MVAKAIFTVSKGETFFDPNVAFRFMNDYVNDYFTIGKSQKITL
jgi:two-component system response regulator NreC